MRLESKYIYQKKKKLKIRIEKLICYCILAAFPIRIFTPVVEPLSKNIIQQATGFFLLFFFFFKKNIKNLFSHSTLLKFQVMAATAAEASNESINNNNKHIKKIE